MCARGQSEAAIDLLSTSGDPTGHLAARPVSGDDRAVCAVGTTRTPLLPGELVCVGTTRPDSSQSRRLPNPHGARRTRRKAAHTVGWIDGLNRLAMPNYVLFCVLSPLGLALSADNLIIRSDRQLAVMPGDVNPCTQANRVMIMFTTWLADDRFAHHPTTHVMCNFASYVPGEQQAGTASWPALPGSLGKWREPKLQPRSPKKKKNLQHR
jgi:hypothetical protein